MIKNALNVLIVAATLAATIVIRSELGGSDQEFASVVVYGMFFAVILVFGFLSYRHRIGIPVLVSCFAVTILLLGFASSGDSPTMLMLSNVFLGLSRGLGILLVGQVLSFVSRKNLRSIVFLGAAIAVVCFPFLLKVLGLSIGTIQLALFAVSLAALLVFMVLERDSRQVYSRALPNADAQNKGKVSWKDVFFAQSRAAQVTLFATIPFFFCSGFFSIFTLDHGYSIVYSDYVIYGLTAVLVLLFVVDKLTRGKSWFNLFCFAIEAVITVTIFFLLVLEDYPLEIFGVMRAGVIVLTVWLIIILSEMSQDHSLPPVFVYVVFAFVCLLPHIIGDVMAYYLLPMTAHAGSVLVGGTLLVTVAIAGVIIILYVNNKNLDTEFRSFVETSPQNGEAPDRDDGNASSGNARFKAMCDQYGVSEKESEVIYLYTQGRSVRSISSKLYVSESTVRTYIQRVYAKLDIHNKQALLDILDNIE